MKPMPWTARTFTFDLPVGWYPAVLSRLRGTPARAESLVRGAREAVLATRPGTAWSVKEHIGHLDDLEELDRRRLAGFLAREPSMAAADMTNRRTEDARHNSTTMRALLDRLGRNRLALVEEMEQLGEEEVAISARHPRLECEMRLIDWAYFVAEHDDHHLAHVRALLR